MRKVDIATAVRWAVFPSLFVFIVQDERIGYQSKGWEILPLKFI